MFVCGLCMEFFLDVVVDEINLDIDEPPPSLFLLAVIATSSISSKIP